MVISHPKCDCTDEGTWGTVQWASENISFTLHLYNTSRHTCHFRVGLGFLVFVFFAFVFHYLLERWRFVFSLAELEKAVPLLGGMRQMDFKGWWHYGKQRTFSKAATNEKQESAIGMQINFTNAVHLKSSKMQYFGFWELVTVEKLFKWIRLQKAK